MCGRMIRVFFIFIVFVFLRGWVRELIIFQSIDHGLLYDLHDLLILFASTRLVISTLEVLGWLPWQKVYVWSEVNRDIQQQPQGPRR